jgi:3-hydroxyacyl-CoA dehydrogenase
MKAIVYGEDQGARFAWQAVANNLIYAAKRIPEISDTIVEIDNAMKWGFNFEMGPFETWDAIDVPTAVAKMEADGFEVPAPVKKMLADGHKAFYKTENGQTYYYDFASADYQPVQTSANIVSLKALKANQQVVKSNASASLIDLGEDVFCLEFHTKMNALNQEIIAAIYEALDYVDANGAGLVIGNQAGGMPGAFSAGADLVQVSEAAKAGHFSEIEEMIRQLQYGLQAAKYAPFPVVAAPYGLALGGGCEVCLGADKIVAHSELYMGLVEIGVGLLPAGGGCMNLWKRFVETIPAAVTEIDLAKFFVPTFMAIAMAKVSMSAAEARANGFLRAQDRIVFNRDYLIGEAKKEALNMVAAGYTPPVKRPLTVLGQAAQGMINAEIANMQTAGYVSEYDGFLARRIAFVISGGEVRENSQIEEDVILTLEREAFLDFLKEEKTIARIEHMLKTGKPLRN